MATGALSGFRAGVWLFFEGAAFLRRERRLWPLASVPVLFALVAVVAATTGFFLQLETIHDTWDAWLPVFEASAWWTWLWVGPARLLVFLAGWLATFLTLAVALVASLLLANLASAPFVDVLSQRIEEIESGHVFDGSSSGGLWRDALRSFASEAARLAFLGGVWILLSVAGVLIPGGGLVTGPALVGVAILFLPLDYAGFALDRRGLSFRDRRRWLGDHLASLIGFGGVAFLACLLPVANLLVLPTLVTAGTLLVLRMPPDGVGAQVRR